MCEDIQFQACMFCDRQEICPSWMYENTDTFLERILGDEVDEDHHHHRYLDDDGWMNDLKDVPTSQSSETNSGVFMKRSKSLGDIDTRIDDDDDDGDEDDDDDDDGDDNDDDDCCTDNNVDLEFDVTNRNNHNSTGGVLKNSDEKQIKNKSSHNPKTSHLDPDAKQLSRRIKRITIDEFVKMTSPFTHPPTPPPMPQLSPIPPITRKSHSNRYSNDSAYENPKINDNSEISTSNNNSKRVKIHDQLLPVNHKKSATKHLTNQEAKIMEMEEFNMKFVSNKNWKDAMISGVDPKELYFRHQQESQNINSLINEYGHFHEITEKRGTTTKKEFLGNCNFSSNRSYSPEVIDRMMEAVERAGEWDWDTNQPSKVPCRRNQQKYKIPNVFVNRKRFKRESQRVPERYSKNSPKGYRYEYTPSESSSENLFVKQEESENMSNLADSYYTTDINQSDASSRKMSSIPLTSEGTPSRIRKLTSEYRGVETVSTAVLMGKYIPRKQFPMDDMTYNQGSRRVLQYLHSLWLEQTTCDVTVIANGGSILAHKLVLASWSPTLASLFKQHNSISEQSHEDLATINMAEYPKDIVADVINFLYTTDIKLDITNIGTVASVAREMDVLTLVNICGDFLIKTCEPDSVLLYYSVAANNELKLAQKGFEGVIASSFAEISEHKYFLNLPYQRLYSILSNPQLCGREIDIFQAVVKWVDFQRRERLPQASSLLKKIRFQHMCMNDLAQKVEFASWIFVDKEPKELLLDAYKFHAMLSSGVSPPGNFRLDKPRCASHNKKKPLIASLNDFREEYNNKLKGCLADQGGVKKEDCCKEDSPKHITPVEITSKEWNQELGPLTKNSGSDILYADPSCLRADKIFEHVQSCTDIPLKNQSFSNNAQFGTKKTDNLAPSNLTESTRISLKTNLKNLKETFSSDRGRKNSLNNLFEDVEIRKLLSNDEDFDLKI